MTDPYLPQGYLPPAQAYYEPAREGYDPNDPLVNPAYAGIGGWFHRIGLMFKTSWKSMTVIFLITHLLPSVGFGVLAVVAGLVFAAKLIESLGSTASGEPQIDPEALEPLLNNLPMIFGIVLISVVILLYLQLVGYASATYAVTHEAIGQRVGLGKALGYGLRRAVGLSGWQVLVWLMAIVGILMCILPGFYVIAATALVGPIFLFERRNPIGRSFSIFHNRFGPVLGRLALIALIGFVANLVSNIFDRLANQIYGTAPELEVLVGGVVLATLFSLIISIPITMFQFSGILLTYTEHRGHEGPVNARNLAGEL